MTVPLIPHERLIGPDAPLANGVFVKISGAETELGHQVEGAYGLIVDGGEPTVITECVDDMWLVYVYGEDELMFFWASALTSVPREEALA